MRRPKINTALAVLRIADGVDEDCKVAILEVTEVEGKVAWLPKRGPERRLIEEFQGVRVAF